MSSMTFSSVNNLRNSERFHFICFSLVSEEPFVDIWIKTNWEVQQWLMEGIEKETAARATMGSFLIKTSVKKTGDV